MTRTLLVLILLSAAPARGEPPSAASMSPEARGRLDRGLRYYATQEYAKAIEEFKAGYQIEPRPQFLYALGQAQRLSGDCSHALDAYRAFLRSGPPGPQE